MGGFFPIGGGGFGFRPIVDATEDGLESFSPPKTGLRGGRPPGIGGAGGAPGGFGAAPCGGLGTELRDVSGSDRYGALLWSAPVLTPPAFLNFGMPPANKPPSCGADAIALSPPPVSLLLLARFPPPGTGGARPGGAGAFPMPGTGGAPPMGGPLGPLLTFPIVGADRSLICVTFFSLVPLPMSDSSAPCGLLATLYLVGSSRSQHLVCSPGVVVAYSSRSRRRLCSWSLHSRHWRRRRRPSSAASHGRHGRRGRWCGHDVVCPSRRLRVSFSSRSIEDVCSIPLRRPRRCNVRSVVKAGLSCLEHSVRVGGAWHHLSATHGFVTLRTRPRPPTPHPPS